MNKTQHKKIVSNLISIYDEIVENTASIDNIHLFFENFEKIESFHTVTINYYEFKNRVLNMLVDTNEEQPPRDVYSTICLYMRVRIKEMREYIYDCDHKLTMSNLQS